LYFSRRVNVLYNALISPAPFFFSAVNALIDHEDVKAVTFVGTSHIAEMVSQRCHKLNKRVLALGGAKVCLV
jgi:acyl-CoA reductase-like NAD-dependent aldehyde dehydrogenase